MAYNDFCINVFCTNMFDPQRSLRYIIENGKSTLLLQVEVLVFLQPVFSDVFSGAHSCNATTVLYRPETDPNVVFLYLSKELDILKTSPGCSDQIILPLW